MMWVDEYLQKNCFDRFINGESDGEEGWDDVYISDSNSTRIRTSCCGYEGGRFPDIVPRWAMDGGLIEREIQKKNDFFMSRFLFPATVYATVAVNHG